MGFVLEIGGELFGFFLEILIDFVLENIIVEVKKGNRWVEVEELVIRLFK